MSKTKLKTVISSAFFELHCLQLASQKSLLDLPPGFAREGTFVRMIIGLRDVLRLLDNEGYRLTFGDDLPEGDDITDAVYRMRNACCHLGSNSRDVFSEGTKVSFAIGFPMGKVRFRRPGESDVVMECPYPDDLSYHYGKLRLLHKRHFCRAVMEAKIELEKLGSEHGVVCPSWFGRGP